MGLRNCILIFMDLAMKIVVLSLTHLLLPDMFQPQTLAGLITSRVTQHVPATNTGRFNYIKGEYKVNTTGPPSGIATCAAKTNTFVVLERAGASVGLRCYLGPTS